MKRKGTIAILLAAVVVLPSAVMAQEYGIPRILLEEQSSSRDTESQIIIRVRNTNERSNLCGSGFDLSRIGISSDGFDFPRPGGVDRGYDYPRPGSATSFDYPRPARSVNYFQLPTGAKLPDIIGCVDTQRNIVFINIFKPQIRQQSTPEVPQPKPSPSYNPDQLGFPSRIK